MMCLRREQVVPPESCLLGEGKPESPSLLEAMWNSSVESLIMAYSEDGGPRHLNRPPLGERFRPPK
jgi:hypothetical protein